MKLYCEQGRFCVDCDEFKEWSEFGNHKKGTNGYRSHCRGCNTIRSGVVPRNNNIHRDADKLIEIFNNRRLRKNEKEIRKVLMRCMCHISVRR